MVGDALQAATGHSGEHWNDGVAATIDTVGDAWSWLVMYESAMRGITRFEGFQRQLGIARSTLTARLESLCSGGLLAKEGREYRPTPAGRDFVVCLLMAVNWGERWSPAPGGPSLTVEHTGCGGTEGASMHCEACGRYLVAKEASFERMPLSPVASGVGRSRMPGLDLLERTAPRAVARTLKVTGDRWSSLVLRGAFFGLHRFDEFERALGIAPNILSQRLSKLVELEVLHKTPYLSRPHRYTYRLTERGLDLYPMYVAMLSWGVTWTGATPNGLRLRHLPCGRDLRPSLRCRSCGDAVTPDDLRFSSPD
ncbi:winged helix-turn-helix transcriptional regulator [Streptomyces sp. NPDC051956]|uniref:winged helix-turn-helix transcriptional regulator n=1 Tax=Streptomyces sp. NPDC051956 TaxID=3365677 RepID=UPI0037D547E5